MRVQIPLSASLTPGQHMHFLAPLVDLVDSIKSVLDKLPSKESLQYAIDAYTKNQKAQAKYYNAQCYNR